MSKTVAYQLEYLDTLNKNWYKKIIDGVCFVTKPFCETYKKGYQRGLKKNEEKSKDGAEEKGETSNKQIIESTLLVCGWQGLQYQKALAF